MKILCVGYRDWAIKIYKNLNLNKKKKIYFHCTRSGLNKKISKLSPNIILFYGWSWKIEEKILNCRKAKRTISPASREPKIITVNATS